LNFNIGSRRVSLRLASLFTVFVIILSATVTPVGLNGQTEGTQRAQSAVNATGIEAQSAVNATGIEAQSAVNATGIEAQSAVNATGIEEQSAVNATGIEEQSAGH